MNSRRTADRAARFDRWFDYPRAASPSVAHDGRTVYFLSDRAGLPHAWQIDREGGEPRSFFGGAERVAGVLPNPGGPGAVVAVDQGGDEHYQLVLADEGGRVVRELTSEPSRIHRPGAWTEAGEFFFTSNERDVRFFDVYRVVPHDPGPVRRVRAEDALVDVLDAREGRLLLARANTNLDSDLLLRDGSSETVLLPHEGEVTVFDALLRGGRAYAAANPEREVAALFALALSGGSPELLAAFDGDLEHIAADRTGERLCLAYNDRGYSRLALFDLRRSELTPVDLPEPGVVGSLVAAPDGSEFLFPLSGASLGTDIFAVEAEHATLRRLSLPSVAFPGARTLPTVFEVRASDGLSVPSWSYEPEGPSRGTIVLVHGGPESQARPNFYPLCSFLLGEGYRIVRPNVRGSLGYGRSFVHLDDGRRRMDSVRDLMETVRALRDGATPVRLGEDERIGVFGGSYGGFMVLSSITTYPELFDAAVDVVGISNFITFLERTGAWRRKVREDEYGSLERDRDFLTSISPLHRADRIRTPLLVVHGENDPRVPLYEAEQIVTALERRGVPVEFLRYANEGHGLVRRENQREAYLRAAAFFDRHLARGG